MNDLQKPAGPTASSVSFDSLHAFASRALVSVGLNPIDAKVAADVLVTTDAWGVFTHGTKALAGYLRRLQLGGLKPGGVPKIAADGGAWALVDGDSALGMIPSVFAMETAMAKARRQGIAYVGVRNSCHFGAAGYYTWLAARAGLIGISMANDIPSVAAPGSRAAVTGSNPLSYAVPAGRYRPMLLDMSTATAAGGKVYAARMRGEPIPDTWLLDGDGRPTTDPSGYPAVGALQPAAGHKGYGLALLIETLSGVATGAAVTWQVRSWMWDDGLHPTNHGAAFIVIDPSIFMPGEDFGKRMEALIEEIHAAPVAVSGPDHLRVPGEMEWESYEKAMKDGISLPEDVRTNLQKAADMTGIPWDA